MYKLQLLIVLAVIAQALSFFAPFGLRQTGISLSMQSSDPNFDLHLPSLLKKGTATDRPDPELAAKLRKRYSQMIGTKKRAARALGTTNVELAAELDELAIEMEETSEKFALLAETWDAWGRPDPDLPRQLREKVMPTIDPNFEEHLPEMLKKGMQDRPDPQMPSAIRLLKYKQTAAKKRLAAAELKKINPALAEELEDIALEIEESHERFEILACVMKERMEYEDNSKAPPSR
jgi:hypothetical protein